MSIIKRQTLLGTFYSYLGVAVGTLSQAYFIPNYFSLEQNGLIQILFSFVYIFVILGGLGFNQAGIRFFSHFRDQSQKHKGYVALGLFVSLIGFAICAAILYFFKEPLIASKKENTLFADYYYVLYPIIFSTILFNFFDSYNKGLFKTVFGTFLSQFLTRFIGLTLVLGIVFKLYSFPFFMKLWPLVFIVPALLILYNSISLGGFSLKRSPFFKTAPFKKEFYSLAAYSMVGTLSSIIITQVDRLFVYKYLGLEQTGIYSICILFGSVMTMALTANLKASTAIVVDALNNKEINKVEQIFKKSGITQLIFGTLLLVLVWCNLDTLFLFIKEEYSAGKIALIIIGVAKLYDLSNGVNSLILLNSDYYKTDSYLVLSFVVVLVILNSLLIPKYGLNGAAIAALIATVYYNSFRSALIYKYFKIHPFTKKQLAVLLIGIAILGLGLLLPSFENTKLQMLGTIAYKSILLGTIYSIAIYVFRLSEDINNSIKQALNSIF